MGNVIHDVTHDVYGGHNEMDNRPISYQDVALQIFYASISILLQITGIGNWLITYIVDGDVIAGDDDVMPCPNDDVSGRIHAASTANSERTM